MKMILASIGALLMVGLNMSPAHAAWEKFDQVDCGSAPQAGHLAGSKYGDDRFTIEGTIDDAGSGAPHNWNWKMIHNGDVSYQGSGDGDFTRTRTMVNVLGEPDVIKWVVDSNSGSIHCVAQIQFG